MRRAVDDDARGALGNDPKLPQTANAVTVRMTARYRRLTRAEAALVEALQDESSEPRRRGLASALEASLRAIPAVLDTDRGYACLAMIAEVREDWRTAASHRHMQAAYMGLMRELARTEAPLARRAIMRDFSTSRLAKVYEQMAADLRNAGLNTEARRATAAGKEVAGGTRKHPRARRRVR